MNPLFAFDGVRHLTDDRLLPSRTDCPLCGGRDWRRVFIVQRDPEVSLMGCRACHGASVSRMPSPEALAVFYAGFYAGVQGEHVTFGNVDRFGRHLFRYVRPLAARGALRILDYGGGDGAIAVNLADRLVDAGVSDVEVLVADFDAGLARPCHPCVRVARVDGTEAVTPASMDIVLASGVLEHVPEPVGTARTLLGRMNAGGRFYARTPHVLPYMYLSGAKAVDWFFPFPAHLHDLGQRFWEHAFEHLLGDTGCHLVSSRPAIVQASFAQHPKIALASYVMKAPWYPLGRCYPFVGGWEIVATKN